MKIEIEDIEYFDDKSSVSLNIYSDSDEIFISSCRKDDDKCLFALVLTYDQAKELMNAINTIIKCIK